MPALETTQPVVGAPTGSVPGVTEPGAMLSNGEAERVTIAIGVNSKQFLGRP